MGFLERETSSKSANPTKRFLGWKGGNGQGFFTYWDKELGEEGEEVQVQPKLKFVVLEEYNTIKGWSDSEQAGIYSNEVLRTTQEELNVKTFSGKNIASGLYKDIKNQVKSAGGKFTKSVYCVTPEGDLINLQLKGAALMAWSDFTKDNFKALKTNFVEIDGVTEGKKGAIKYFTPNFKLGATITDSDLPTIKEVASEFKEYIDGYMGNEESPEDPQQARMEAEEEVPF